MGLPSPVVKLWPAWRKARPAIASPMAVLLILAAAPAGCHPVSQQEHAAHPATYYVSPSGNGKNGRSWATAWRNTSLINWSAIKPGSEIILDGGKSRCGVSPYNFKPGSPDPGVTCGQRYAPFSVGQNDITIERSTAAGRGGTVVIDGGRDTPLPYCGQRSYSAAGGAPGGIDLNGHSGVVIDGMTRAGIVVRGAQDGVLMRGGGHDTLRNMEIFDNGYAISNRWGYSSDGQGVVLDGEKNVYDRLLVHDNGQDEFHSGSEYHSGIVGYSVSGSVFSNSWLGAVRANPRYPDEPFNDLQVSGHDPGCTHADGVQIFEPGTTMSGLTFSYDVFGPGTNTGLFPSDGGTGATVDDVTVDDSLFLSPASVDIMTVNPVHGWELRHDTLIAAMGALLILGNGKNTMTDVIKYGGSVYTQGGSWSTSGNVWYGGDPLPGASANRDPAFPPFPRGTLPSLASLLAATFTPSETASGSPLHSLSELLRRIDSLNAPREKPHGGLLPAPGAKSFGPRGRKIASPVAPCMPA